VASVVLGVLLPCSMVGKNDHGAQGAAFALFVLKKKKKFKDLEKVC
jgi:hypothetical protein